MRYDEARPGRVFILRLFDGELIQDSIEYFALKKEIMHAKVQMIGGVDKGSKLIVGPRVGRGTPIEPMVIELEEMYESVGNGTIAPDGSGAPKLHCHLVCGRGKNSICGEIREGVITWHVMEIVITELTGAESVRTRDTETGFDLLYPPNDL